MVLLKHFFVRADLLVALILFDPFLFAAFLFPPQEYPGTVWILFVEPPSVSLASGPHNQRETLFMNSDLGGDPGSLCLSLEELLLQRADP